jgi:DNA-binding transcriptional ArsR family regulator
MPDDPLSLTFAALADPTRRAILARLAQGEATVNELAEPFAMTVQAVSKHLKVLEAAGLISRGHDGQARPRRLEPDAMAPAIDWIERHRRVWTDRFDQLEVHLRAIQTAANATRDPPPAAPETPRSTPESPSAARSKARPAKSPSSKENHR